MTTAIPIISSRKIYKHKIGAKVAGVEVCIFWGLYVQPYNFKKYIPNVSA